MDQGSTASSLKNEEALCAQARLAEETDWEKAKFGSNKWTDDVIRRLILLWGERPALYDTKHELYFNKTKRRESMLEICEDLNMSLQEIHLKMVSLRTYYGSQQRKKIAWENDQTKTTPFKSRWQFWIPLQFLQDHMTQKPAEKKIAFVLEDDCQSPEVFEDNDKDESDDDKTNSLRSRAVKRKVEKDSNFMDLEVNTEPASHTEEFRGKQSRTEHRVHSTRTDDELFAEIILKSLAKIEEGEAKEALKLEIQNLIFKTRFGTKSSAANFGPTHLQSTLASNYLYAKSILHQGKEMRLFSNNGSDEEPSMAGRRKPINPKRSVQSDTMT